MVGAACFIVMATSTPRSLLVSTLSVGLALVAVAVLGSRFAGAYWALELPGHFRAQLSVVALGMTLGLVAVRAWREVAVAVPVSGLIAAPVAMLWFPAGGGAVSGETVRVLSLNVSFYDRNHREVVDLITTHDPDVVGLVEVTDRWMDELAVLADEYGHRVFDTTRRGGVAILSRRRLAATEFRPFASHRRSYGLTTMFIDERPVTLVVVHTASPMWAARAALRDEQLALLAALDRQRPGREVILVGDFNTSPWSLAFERLLRETGWRYAASGFGYRPTWPSTRPWLRIPIDHHIVSDGIAVLNYEVVGPTGSDHLAVFSDLGLRAAAAGR